MVKEIEFHKIRKYTLKNVVNINIKRLNTEIINYKIYLRDCSMFRT